MAELAYEPNSVAQSLRTNVTKAIGILVSDITNPFFASVVRGAEDLASDSGYSLIVCNSDERRDKEAQYVEFLVRRRIDGLLLSPTSGCSADCLESLYRRRIPLVFVDRSIRDAKAFSVLSDNTRGAQSAVKHLIGLGHRDIGVVLGIPGTTTSDERLRGYERALRKHELPIKQEYVQWGAYRAQGGVDAARSLLALDQRPTAIFCSNNTMTVGVMTELRRQGLTIPEDISLVSFDDVEWSELITPPLTAVMQHPLKMGHQAMQLLLDQLTLGQKAKPKTIRVPVRLTVRGSSAAPRKQEER